MILPYKFTEDRWVQMAEVRPGNRARRAPRDRFRPRSRVQVGSRPKAGRGLRARAEQEGQAAVKSAAICWAALPRACPPHPPAGQGRLIKAGSDIVFQLHYTANGKPAHGHDPRRHRVRQGAADRARHDARRDQSASSRFPPGDADYRVDAEFELGHEVRADRHAAAHAPARQGLRVSR